MVILASCMHNISCLFRFAQINIGWKGFRETHQKIYETRTPPRPTKHHNVLRYTTSSYIIYLHTHTHTNKASAEGMWGVSEWHLPQIHLPARPKISTKLMAFLIKGREAQHTFTIHTSLRFKPHNSRTSHPSPLSLYSYATTYHHPQPMCQRSSPFVWCGWRHNHAGSLLLLHIIQELNPSSTALRSSSERPCGMTNTPHQCYTHAFCIVL